MNVFPQNDPPLFVLETLEPRIAPAGDLIATVISVKLPNFTVPGDAGTITFEIKNIAPALADKADKSNHAIGTTGLHINLSADGVSTTFEEIGKVQNVKFNLAPGASKKFTGKFIMPELYLMNTFPAEGDYFIQVEADSGHRIFESNEGNNFASSEQAFPFVFQFGDVGSRKGVTLKGYDQNFNPFALKMTGGGSGDVTPGANVDIALTGTTAKSALSGTMVGSSLRNISADGPMKSITLPGAFVKGDVTLLGGIETLFLADTGGSGADITIGGSKPVKSITLGQVSDLNISAPSGITTLQVIDWDAVGTDTITAPFITNLKSLGAPKVGINGDFEASLNLSGEGAPKKVVLGNATIAGALLGGTWDINGGASSTSGDIAAEAASGWKLDAEGSVGSLIFPGSKDLPGSLIGDKSDAGFTVRASSFKGILAADDIDAKIVASGLVEKTGLAIGSILAETVNGAVVEAAAGGIGSLKLGEWLNGGSVTTKWLGEVSTDRKIASGDFSANLTTTDARGSKEISIEDVSIGGTLKSSTWSIFKDVSIFHTAAIENSQVTVGKDVLLLVVGGKGVTDVAFKNSNINVSGHTFTAVVTNVDPSSSGSTFGLTTATIKSYTRYEAGKPKPVVKVPDVNPEFTGVGDSNDPGKYRLTITKGGTPA